MIDDMEYLVNFQEDLEEIGSEAFYLLSYAVPFGPTYNLIKEYRKPKSERIKAVIVGGWAGTGFCLTTKIILPAVGISLVFLNPFNLFYDETPKEQTTIEAKVDSTKISPNNLEKTLHINQDKTN